MPEPVDILGTIKQMADQIERERAEQIDYFVTDDTVSIMGKALIREKDSDGKTYVRIPPSMLDGVKRETLDYNSLNLRMLTGEATINAVIGIPIYKREDMKEGWPY